VTDRWTDRLSKYVDGSLEAGEALALEAHLAECAECAATLQGLRAVTARAAALPPREPARDLWPGIAARLEARSAERPSPAAALAAGLRGFIASLTARRISLSLPQLAAAALALVLVSGGAVWIAFQARPTLAPAPAPVALQPAPAPEATSVGFAQYDSAIAELERVLSARRSSLDTSTVRVVEQNLAAIDQAIAEARRALAADPTDPYLHDHLANTMRRKMGLLRRVTTAAYST
jgi:hypothetical protein